MHDTVIRTHRITGDALPRRRRSQGRLAFHQQARPLSGSEQSCLTNGGLADPDSSVITSRPANESHSGHETVVPFRSYGRLLVSAAIHY